MALPSCLSSLTKVEETEAGLNLTVETEDGVKDLQADDVCVITATQPLPPFNLENQS